MASDATLILEKVDMPVVPPPHRPRTMVRSVAQVCFVLRHEQDEDHLRRVGNGRLIY
jgi:hypothetical protein